MTNRSSWYRFNRRGNRAALSALQQESSVVARIVSLFAARFGRNYDGIVLSGTTVRLDRRNSTLSILHGSREYSFPLHKGDRVSEIEGVRIGHSQDGITVVTLRLHEATGWVFADFPLIAGRQTYFTYDDGTLRPETEDYASNRYTVPLFNFPFAHATLA